MNRKPPPELLEAMEAARQRFVAKFGREPGPTDPLLFDEEADEPQPMDVGKLSREMIEAMEQAGTPGHLIYAFKRTGLMLTQETYDRAPEEDKFDWDEAMEEYREFQAKGIERPWRGN